MNSDKRYQNIELLAPAGSMETFRAVIHAGADAVYLGGGRFGARAYANNFTEEELLSAIDYAHIHGRKVYLTVNTLFKERELNEELYSYLLPYYEQGLDAVIIQDMGAFRLVREAFPGLSIHTSTQMTVTNRYGAMMMKELGADRVVTAREMSLAEIRDIKEHVDIEIESFVHGALCYCYSGQCLLSSMLGGRSGNRGRCAQPCRLAYEVLDEKKHPVKTGKKERELYILSPKDLCTVSMIPDLIENGVDSFKIEGRMKQPEYAAGVVSVYRKYIDRYINACLRTDEVTAKKDFKVTKEDMQHLYDFGNRSGFTDGYYKRHNGREMITLDKPSHTKGNEALWEEIKEQYVRSEKKEKINGTLRLKKDFPAKLEVTLNDISVSVDGDVVQAALKQPLAEEKVAASIKKTGNTPYEFAELDIDMDDDIFLPVQALNVLRRNALDLLSEALTAPMRRTEAIRKTENVQETESTQKTETAQRPEMMAVGESSGVEWQKETVSVKKEKQAEKDSLTPYLSVSIENRSCITLLLDVSYVDAIYLDSSCYTRENLFTALKEDASRIHSTGKKAYYIMPAVFRLSALLFYEKNLSELKQAGVDGFVVKSYDALAFVREKLPDAEVIADHNLYTWNSCAKAQLQNAGITCDTVPLELNRKELQGRDNTYSEMLLYGNLPLMVSAQCVHANAGADRGCDKMRTVTYLKDRYGKYFPVKNNCTECYNTIYNTAPLILFPYRKELEKMGICAYRISFTTEQEPQVKQILHLYEKVFLNGENSLQELYTGEYTGGHYKRGVE